MSRKKHKSVAEITCAAKAPFPSRAAAARVLKQQVSFLDVRGKDRPALAVYRCGVCRQFHIGGKDLDRAAAAAEPYKRERFRPDPEDLTR